MGKSSIVGVPQDAKLSVLVSKIPQNRQRVLPTYNNGSKGILKCDFPVGKLRKTVGELILWTSK